MSQPLTANLLQLIYQLLLSRHHMNSLLHLLSRPHPQSRLVRLHSRRSLVCYRILSWHRLGKHIRHILISRSSETIIYHDHLCSRDRLLLKRVCFQTWMNDCRRRSFSDSVSNIVDFGWRLILCPAFLTFLFRKLSFWIFSRIMKSEGRLSFFWGILKGCCYVQSGVI